MLKLITVWMTKVEVSNLFNLTFPVPTVLKVSTTVPVSSNEACNNIFANNFLPKPTQQLNYLTTEKLIWLGKSDTSPLVSRLGQSIL